MVKVRHHIRRGTRSDVRKWPKSRGLTKTRPMWRHRCRVSSIWGCWMILNSTCPIRFTMAGRPRNDSGWSWTFRLGRVTLHGCKAAPTVSQLVAHAVFLLSVWPSSRLIFVLESSPSNIMERNRSDQNLRWCSCLLKSDVLHCWHVWYT